MCSHWQPGAAADFVATCAAFLTMFTILSSMTSTETANINGSYNTKCVCIIYIYIYIYIYILHIMTDTSLFYNN